MENWIRGMKENARLLNTSDRKSGVAIDFNREHSRNRFSGYVFWTMNPALYIFDSEVPAGHQFV